MSGPTDEEIREVIDMFVDGGKYTFGMPAAISRAIADHLLWSIGEPPAFEMDRDARLDKFIEDYQDAMRSENGG